MKVYKEIDAYGNIRYRNEKRQLHRTDGPAIEWTDGSKEWYINNQQHRLDGPAREWPTGHKFWYINDQRLTEEQFNSKLYRILYI
jgi:hypothetical protein